MTNPIPHAKTGDETNTPTDRGLGTTYPGTPRWVKVAGIVVVVLGLLVVIIMLLGGGDHGPGRHTPLGSGTGYTPTIAIGVVSNDP